MKTKTVVPTLFWHVKIKEMFFFGGVEYVKITHRKGMNKDGKFLVFKDSDAVKNK